MAIREEQSKKLDNPHSKIQTIDRVFVDGSSTVTFLGRNDGIIRRGLSIIDHHVRNILILGSGCYEPWTTAGQEKLNDVNTRVTAVDRSSKITKINETIKLLGGVFLDEITAVVGNPVFGKEKQRDSQDLLDAAKIHGVKVEDKKMVVEESNRHKVQIETSADAIPYVQAQQPSSVDFIFSGNLENNLIYQNGYDYSTAVSFHKNIARLLRQRGIYAFTTNDIFFNDLTPNSTKNVLQGIEEADLDVLYKATQYTHVLERAGDRIMTENCAVMCAKKGEYESLPHAGTLIEKTRRQFSEHYSDYQLSEGEGSLNDLRQVIGNNQTNLVLIKIGKDKFHWFNMQGKYSEVFSKLATDNTGFYPDFLFSDN